jgi:hypothetical protein
MNSSDDFVSYVNKDLTRIRLETLFIEEVSARKRLTLEGELYRAMYIKLHTGIKRRIWGAIYGR